MSDFRVVIDAGHGGSDPGSVANNLKEKDLTLAISNYMYERFLEKGIPATLVRSTDETVSPNERVRRILAAYGNNPNVIVLSNHINSSANPNTAEGAEVIYALRNEDTLAKNILSALESQGQVVRRVYQRTLPSDPSKDYYFIHRDTGVTEPLIIEYAFINNEEDIRRLQQNYRRYVDAIVDAVIRTEGGNVSKPNEITYVVKSGDSLWKIANLYNTTVYELKRINNLTNDLIVVGQVLKVPYSEPVISPSSISYTVKSGDSLWSIAKRYNISVDTLKEFNGLTSILIIVGQILRIPLSNTVYVVKAGDTLWSIANRYGTTVNELKRLNNLSSDLLSMGQVLKLA